MVIKRKVSGSRILVTVAAGFIGSNLVEDLLDNDNEVVGFDNFSTGSMSNVELFNEHPRFTFIQGDIRDLNHCKRATDGVDYVLHQAALGSVPRPIKDPITTNDVNITGFLNMLVAAKETNVKRFVYATSSSFMAMNSASQKWKQRLVSHSRPMQLLRLLENNTLKCLEIYTD